MGSPREFQAEEQRLKAAKQWAELAQLYEARGNVVDDPGKERLLYKAGEVATDRLNDARKAEDLFLQSFTVRRSFLPAIGALKVLHTNTKNTRGLLQVIGFELEITTDPRRRGQLLCEQGELLLADEPEEALQAFSKAIEVYPKNRLPLDALEKLAHGLKRFDILVQAYRDLAHVAKPKQAAVYHFLGGMLLDERLKDRKGSTEAFHASLDSGAAEPRILKVIGRYFERVKDWDGLAKTLWSHLDGVKDDKDRCRLFKRQAWVQEVHLRQPERAQRLLQKAAKADPEDASALESLLRVSKALGDPRGMAEALEGEAGLRTLGDKAKADRLQRAAEQRDKARDGKRAYQNVKKSLILRPRHPRALKLLERITRRLGKWSEHASVLAQELELLKPGRSDTEREAALVILRRVADVSEQKLDDKAGARRALVGVVDLAPEDGKAWSKLATMAKAEDDWQGVCDLLAKRIEVTRGEAARLPFLRELAGYQRDMLQDLNAAVATLGVLIALAPRDTEGLAALCGVYQAQSSWDLLTGTLARLSEATSDPLPRASVLRQLGQVLLEKQGKPAEARDALRESLGLEGDGPGGLEAWKLLAKAAEALSDDGLLREALGAVQGFEQDPETLRWVRIQLAKVEERAGNVKGALGSLEEILAEGPADPDALPAVVRLLTAEGRLEDAAKRLKTARTILEPQPDRAGPVARDLASLLDESIGDPVRAFAAWEATLLFLPDDVEALERVTRHGRALESFQQLFDLLVRTTGSAKEAPQRHRMWREQTSLAAGPLEQPQAAILIHERLLAELPGDPQSCAALRGLYRMTERWGELAQLLDVCVSERVEGIEAESCLRELSSVCVEQLGDLPRGAEALEKVLADGGAASDPAWDSLATVYGSLERHADQVRVRERAAAAAVANPQLKAERLTAAAEIYEKRLLDYDNAVRVLDEALEATPGVIELLLRQAGVQRAAGRFAEATEVLEVAAKKVGKAGDSQDASSLLLERGKLLAEQLGDPKAAEDAFGKAIETFPANAAAHEALINLLTGQGRWEALSQALGRAAENATDLELRAMFLARQGSALASRLDRLEEGLAAFDLAETARPKLAFSRQARVVALRLAGRPDLLAAALAARREADPVELDTQESLRSLREEAELRAFRLNDQEAARDLLTEALRIRPKDLPSLRSLVRVDRQLGLGEELVEHLEALASLQRDEGRRATLLLEAGRVLKTRASDLAGAKRLLARALEADPGRIEAVRWLVTISREQGDQADLASWLEHEAKLEADPLRRAELYTRLGRLRRKVDSKAARLAFERALTEDPRHLAALRSLAPILREAKAWKDLARALEKLAPLEPDPRLRLERWVALGEVRLQALRQPAEARVAYDRALELSPGLLKALHGRSRTFSEDDDAAGLVEALRAEMVASPRAERRVAIGRRIAALQTDRLQDYLGAAKSLEDVLRLRPLDREAWRLLREIHVQQKDYEELANSYEREARHSPDVQLQEECFRSAAQIAQHHLQDLGRAADLFLEVLERGDPQVLAVSELPPLLLALEREDDYERVLRKTPDVVPHSAFACQAHILLGDRALERGESGVAVGEFEAALLQKPDSLRPLDRLADVHRTQVAYPLLINALSRKRDLLGAEAKAVDLHLEVAQLFEEKLQDLNAAVDELLGAAALTEKVEHPSRGKILGKLRILCRRCERYDDLTQILGTLATAIKDPKKASGVLIERAKVERDQLGNTRAAIVSYQSAFARHRTLASLEPLLELLERAELWEEMAMGLEDKARLSEEVASQAAALARAAQVQDERLERPEAAIAAWEQVLDLVPDHAHAFKALGAICARTKNARAHARALERELAALGERADDPSSSERAVECALQAAKLHLGMRARGRAVAVLEAGRKVSPSDRRLFERLDAIFTEDTKFPLLYELLEARAALVEDAHERAGLHERLAVLAGKELVDPEAERRHWAVVLSVHPGHSAAVMALKRTHAVASDWQALAEVMRGEVEDRGARTAEGDVEAGEGLADLYLALGGVLESKLDELTDAVWAYSEAAARAKGDVRPLVGLERIHQAQESWAELVRVRQVLRDHEADPQGRAKLSLKIADACDRLEQRSEAIAALREALEETPDDLGVLSRLRHYLVQEERWDEASRVLAREADAVPERATEFDRRVERAELLRDRLDRPDEAIVELERARGLAPQNAGPLLSLTELYKANHACAPLVDVLEARASLEEADAQAADLYSEAAALNAAQEPAQAAAGYERALRRDPLRAEALEALDELYARQERWTDQARALHRRADLARAEDDDARPFLRRAAEVEEAKAGSRALAATTLERLLEGAPEDAGALAELARLRGELGEHASHEVVLGRLARLAEGKQMRSLLLERSAILDGKLGRPAAAAACVRIALLDLAETPGASEEEIRQEVGELMRLEEAAQNPVGLLDACEVALRHAKDEKDRMALLTKIGQLTSGPAYRPDRGIEAYKELYTRKPSNAKVVQALEALYRREARHEELVGLFALEGERLKKSRAKGVAARRQRLKYREAELYRGVLRRPREAEVRYKEILVADKGQDEARAGLEAIYRTERLLPELAALLAERATRATSDGEAALALTEEAAVHEERGDDALALERLEAAFARAQSPSVSRDLRGRVLRTLIRLYRRRELFADLARILGALAKEQHLPPEERSGVLAELGVVFERDLGESARAIEAFERALDEDAGNVPAARALSVIYLRAGQLAKVVSAYQREAAAKVDKGRLVWLRNKIGALQHELGERPAARQAYRQALELDSQSLVALRGLAQVCRELDDYAQLAPVLASLASLSASPVDRQEAHRELATVYEEALGDVPQAVATWKKVLAEAPDDLDALVGLAGGLRRLSHKAELVETLEQQLRIVREEQRRRELVLEAGKLREELAEAASQSDERKAQLELALAHAHTASALEPTDTDAIAAYARVAEMLGRWSELAEATCRMARSVDDTAKAGWMLRRAAKIRSLRMSDPKGAAEAYLEAVRANPGDVESWSALEPIARELGDDPLLLQVLERRLQLAAKPAKKADVALRLGLHLIRLNSLPRAIDTLVLAKEHGKGPQRARALEQLEVAYRASERWADLVAVLTERAKGGRLPSARALLLEKAQILERRLGRPNRAIEVLEAVRESKADDLEVIREIERLLSAAGRWTDLVELYEAEAKRLGRGGYDSLVLLGRVARDRLDDPDLAAEALQRAVTMNPSGLDALESLKSLYGRVERWPELLDTLRLEIGLLKDVETKIKRLRYAGQLAEEKLGDLTTAERFFGDASTMLPRDQVLLVSLGRVQEARGEYRGMVETLDRRLALERAPAARLSLLKKKGETLAGQLFRPFEAMVAYRQALEIAANDSDSLVALSRLLRSEGEWEELTQVVTQRLKTAQGKAHVALTLELALVQAHKLNRPEPALKAARQALVQDPRCREAALLQVEVIKELGEEVKPAEVAAALQKMADLSQGAERAEALVELGDLFQDVLKQGPRAKLAFQEAFKADPGNVAALDSLAPLLHAGSQWDELIAAYEGAARLAKGFRCGELLCHSAEVIEERKGDAELAEKRYRKALRYAPAHPPALRGLVRRLMARGAAAANAERSLAEELVRVLLAIAKVDEDPSAQGQALVRAGDVYRDSLALYRQARACYEQALLRMPKAIVVQASLAELTYAAGEHKTALKYLNQVASSPELLNDPERASELLWVRGACLEQLGDSQGAADSYRAVLQQRPGHLQALEDLSRLLILSRAWLAAGRVIGELVKFTRPPKIRASHTLALAKVRAQLEENESAIEFYRDGLKVLPHRFDAHQALAELLKEKDPQAARKHYEYVVSGNGGSGATAGRAEARTQLANLNELVFKDSKAAAGHLEAALQLPGAHRPTTCKHLAEIYGRDGRWSEAVHTLKRAIELEVDESKLGDLHSSLARVLRDRLKELVLARRCFEKALDLNPGDRRTLESLMRLLEAAGDMEAQVRVLELVAKAAAATSQGDESALRQRRAETLLRMNRSAPAAQEFERVLVLDPAHSGAKAKLAPLYLQLGDVRGVERLHREFLAADPLSVPSYQALARAWRAAGKRDAHAQVVQVLGALKAVRDAEDRGLLKTFSERMPRTKAQIKDDVFVASIVHERARGALLELVRKAGHLLLKQVPDDLKKHGIGWRTAKHDIEGDAFPEHALVKRICDLLAIRSLDIYYMQDWKSPEPIIGHSKGAPALILCPEVFNGLSEAQKAFVLGRALGPVRLNLELARALSGADVRLLVLGALKAFDPARRSFRGEDEKTARAVTKAVARATELHSSLRITQEGLWRKRDGIDFEGFRQGVLLTGSRVGLLVCGGMHTAAQALVATNMSLRGRIPENTQGVVKVYREIPELQDLAAFSVSEGYLRVRERCLRTDV